MRRLAPSSVLLLLLCSVMPTWSCADTITYVNWTSSTGPVANTGTVTGTLFGSLNVTYSGELQFAQKGTTSSPWIGYLPASTWESALVSNAPPNAQIVAIDGLTGFTDTVTFSSPVNNLFMDIVSLGQGGVGTNYTFSSPFTILNIGPSAEYGGGATSLSKSGNTLTGHEGDGVIEFAGPISSLSWTAATPEFWNGFTFGADSPATSVVPEPAYPLLIISTGLIAVGLKRWRATAK